MGEFIVVVLWVLATIVGLGIYFLPAAVAISRGHHQQLAIGMLDLFLGWTFLGWVIALVWACTEVKSSEPNAALLREVRRLRQAQEPPRSTPEPRPRRDDPDEDAAFDYLNE